MESKLYKRNKNLFNKELLIIGTSNFGPTNAIVNVSSREDVYTIFGSEGSIYSSYCQIENTLNENISVNIVKSTGEYASACFNLNVQGDNIANDSLIFTSIYTNELYNDVVINVLSDRIEFTFPQMLNLKPISYYYDDYEIVGQLINAINEDTYNAKNIVIANTTVNEYLSFNNSFSVINTSKSLSDGLSGLNCTVDEKYKALEKTLDIISGEEIYLIAATHVFVDEEISYKYEDNRSITFYEQILRFCISQLRYGIVTCGFVTFSDKIKLNYNTLSQITSIMKTCRSNNQISSFQFLVSLTYGDLYYDFKSSFSNSLMFYANVYLNLAPNTNTTNKYLDESYSLKDNLTYEQMKYLESIGIVTFRHSPYFDKVVVCNGVTSVTTLSEFKYIVNVGMVQTIMPAIKLELEKYIGEDLRSVVDSSNVKDDVKKVLTKYANDEVIDKYEFGLVADFDNGELVCNLTLKTAFMVEDIKLIGKINFDVLEDI